MISLIRNKYMSLLRYPDRAFFYTSLTLQHRGTQLLWILALCTLSGCASIRPQTSQEQAQKIAMTRGANLDHIVPTTLAEATENPSDLGLYSPLGTSTSMTSNNTGLQTVENTPNLASPFVVLKNASLDASPKDGLPMHIAQLIKDKKWQAAIEAIDVFAKKNPRNVQVLFVRTRLLIEQGQLESARQALLAFIERYPEIPEPYNNLAVLYASAGKLDLARDYLELCIKLAPNYATGLQNLGDIYSLLAASQYDKAFKQNRRLTDAERKRKLAQAITAP